MVAVIIINVVLTVLVLVTIVGSHLWAILGSRGPEAQPLAARPVAARNRSRRPRTARALAGATATR